MTEMPMPKVKPVLRLVPNGFSEPGKLRMTLMVTPVRAREGIAIHEWPLKVRKAITTALEKVYFFEGEGPPSPTNLPNARKATIRQSSADDSETKEALERIAKAWSCLGTLDGAVQTPWMWQQLLETTDLSLSSQSFAYEPSSGRSQLAEKDLNSDGSYADQPPTPGEQLKLKAVHSIRQGDMALALEVDRAKDVHKLVKSGKTPPRPLRDSAISKVGDVDASYNLEPRGNHYDAFKQKYKSEHGGKEPDYEEYKKYRASEHGNEIDVEIAKQKRAELAAALALFRDNSAPTLAECKLQQKPNLNSGLAATKDKAKATHTAGTWPQSRKEGAVESNPNLDRLIQSYQAIVSSPAWARFFGFAFDIEVERVVDTDSWVSVGAGPAYVVLVWKKDGEVDPASSENKVDRVWTAVDAKGWPRPYVPPPDVPPLAAGVPPAQGLSNLSDGLFLMSTGCSNGTFLPRYDVVTLDVRNATEAAVRPLNPDGSERRGFQTLGMTLIDRLRAEDVRSQIVRTSKQGQKKEKEIFLYADDLVVGRRLDAGIEQKKTNTIAWRPLGARSITYGLRGDDSKGDHFFFSDPLSDKFLLTQDASGIRTIEESIIYPAARLTPSPGGGPADKDVYVDEAYATWSGAPMGVDTSPVPRSPSTEMEVDRKRARDRELEGRVAFLQKQSLPTASDAKGALVPPLRYGHGYRFGMRAVFLGGHSLSFAAAGELYNKYKQAYTYPSDPVEDKNRYPTRRFLRHEAVGAPSVLLPSTVLNATVGEMDFESVQSAVLRSLPEGYAEPAELETKVRGRPYTKARDRVSADSLERIFVPPQVALEELLRAGKLDNSKTRDKVIEGGLTSVAFGVFKPEASESNEAKAEPQRQGGFPIAMIEEQTAFGFEPTRRKLVPGWNKEPAKKEPVRRGAAILASANAMTGAPFVRRAYYPDPAATRLFLRLRRRSDGKCEGLAQEVEVYDREAVYPNAMPTVVTIKKADKSAAPGSAVLGKPAATNKGGQRAQGIELTLAPGADFDLEAFYFPSDVDLAHQFALTEMIGAYRLNTDPPQQTPGKPPLAYEHVTTGFYNVPDHAELMSIANKLIDFARGGPSAKAQGSTGTTAPPVGGPIEDIAAVVTMRVAHAVNRPLAPPSFLTRAPDFQIYRTGLDTTSVEEVRPAGPDERKPIIFDKERVNHFRRRLENQPGSSSYVLSGRIAFDRRTTSAIEILAICVSPREVLIDDPARRRAPKARVAGAWPNKTVVTNEKGERISPMRVPASELDVYGFSKIDVETGEVTLHRSEVTLLRIDNLAGPGTGLLVPKPATGEAEPGEGTIEVSFGHLAAMVGQPMVDAHGAILLSGSQLHAFPDSKARQLQLRVRAITRFGPDFETAPRWIRDDEKESAHVGGTLPVVRVRQPLQAGEQSIESAKAPQPDRVEQDSDGLITVWLPSSIRPAKCATLSPVPVFRFEQQQGVTTPGNSIIRRSGVRIYLERGWFSSGEGELLGVIVPASAVADQQAQGIASEEMFGPIGPFISRWGGDPIRDDHVGSSVPLTHQTLAGDECGCEGGKGALRKDVIVPIQVPRPPGAEDNVTVLEKADLVTFEPRFDVDREQWFVDLDIHGKMTPNLFVRFGLVRYQPHAISKELEASEPVVVWTQLLPERKFSVESNVVKDACGEYHITATVSGPTHKGVHIPKHPDPDQGANERQKRLGRPTIRFRLVHESREDEELRRTLIDSCEVSFNDDIEGHATSTWRKTVSKSDLEVVGDGKLYIYAEEVETFMPATYASEPAYVENIFSERSFVQSGPRFAARVNVGIDLQDFSKVPEKVSTKQNH